MNATSRRRRNFIRGVSKEDDEWVSEHKAILEAEVDYFQHLFTSISPHQINVALFGLEARVFEAMNMELIRPFDPGEVQAAIFQMNPSKGPGPDGMNEIFYQKH